MPPKGWRKNTVDNVHVTFMEATRWRKEFVPFGHRLNFLSAERQQLNTGKLSILAPKRPERRREEG